MKQFPFYFQKVSILPTFFLPSFKTSKYPFSPLRLSLSLSHTHTLSFSLSFSLFHLFSFLWFRDDLCTTSNFFFNFPSEQREFIKIWLINFNQLYISQIDFKFVFTNDLVNWILNIFDPKIWHQPVFVDRCSWVARWPWATL